MNARRMHLEMEWKKKLAMMYWKSLFNTQWEKKKRMGFSKARVRA